MNKGCWAYVFSDKRKHLIAMPKIPINIMCYQNQLDKIVYKLLCRKNKISGIWPDCPTCTAALGTTGTGAAGTRGRLGALESNGGPGEGFGGAPGQ